MALIRPIPTKASAIDIADDAYVMTEALSSTTSTGTITSGTAFSSAASQVLFFEANVKNFSTLSLTIPSAVIANGCFGIKSDGSIDVLVPTATIDVSQYDYFLAYLRSNGGIWTFNFT